MCVWTCELSFNQLIETESLSCYHSRKELMLLGYLKRNEVLLHLPKVWVLLFNDSISSITSYLFPQDVLFFHYGLQWSIHHDKNKRGVQGGIGWWQTTATLKFSCVFLFVCFEQLHVVHVFFPHVSHKVFQLYLDWI